MILEMRFTMLARTEVEHNIRRVWQITGKSNEFSLKLILKSVYNPITWSWRDWDQYYWYLVKSIQAWVVGIYHIFQRFFWQLYCLFIHHNRTRSSTIYTLCDTRNIILQFNLCAPFSPPIFLPLRCGIGSFNFVCVLINVIKSLPRIPHTMFRLINNGKWGVLMLFDTLWQCLCIGRPAWCHAGTRKAKYIFC